MPSHMHDRALSDTDATGTRQPVVLNAALLFANAAALIAALAMPAMCGTGALSRLVGALA